jgi:DNA polymerase
MGFNDKHQWKRIDTYGGKLTENIVQALSRDIMAFGMVNLEKSNYPIILSVHDELVSETDKDFGSVEEYEMIMCKLPKWAKGLPIKAEGWKGKRYKK